MDVDLSIGERVHVTGKSLEFLKIFWYLYGYITIQNSMEHEQAGINMSVSRDRQSSLSRIVVTLSYVE